MTDSAQCQWADLVKLFPQVWLSAGQLVGQAWPGLGWPCPLTAEGGSHRPPAGQPGDRSVLHWQGWRTAGREGRRTGGQEDRRTEGREDRIEEEDSQRAL